MFYDIVNMFLSSGFFEGIFFSFFIGFHFMNLPHMRAIGSSAEKKQKTSHKQINLVL